MSSTNMNENNSARNESESSHVTSSLAQQGLNTRRPMGAIGAPVEKPKDSRGTLSRLVTYFRRELGLVLLLTVTVLCTVIGNVLAPKFQSNAIDSIVAADFSALPGQLVTMLILYLIGGVATLFQDIISARLSQNIVKRLRSDLFNKIVHLPVSYLDAHSHGDIMSRMTNDAENVSTIISQSMGSLFSGVLTIAGTIIMMLSFSVPLTLLTCTTVIATILVTKILAKLMRKYYLRRQTLLGEVNGIAEEEIRNCRTITAYNLQDPTIRNFEKVSDSLTKAGYIADTIGNIMGPIMNTLSNISFVIVAVFGAWFAVNGYITVGVISAFVVYSKQFSRPINEIAQLYGQIQSALAGAERIFAMLDVESEDFSGSKDSPVKKGVIDFSHINFSYTKEKQVIYDFSLDVRAGKKIALVGSTGCGKTTIVNLLMRFYDPDRGSIRIDGTDIAGVSRETLRGDVGIVLQDSVLFTDTLRANLKYADNAISDEKMMAAARISGCDKIAAALPDGYDTILEGGGQELSQGQRQLITIGRAFLSEPKILILDEATSSVDTRTEKQIQDAMTELMKNRTSLIIAHRLSTIRDSDLIVVMDQGHIVETGNHEQLLAAKGRYYELYETQFAGNAT